MYALSSVEDHLDKAEHDLRISHQLLQNVSTLDWCITCLFYFALHCVSAHARNNGWTTFEPQPNEKISAHRKMINYVNQNMTRLFGTYNRLFDRSMQCRYDPVYFKSLEHNRTKILYQRSKNMIINLHYFPKDRVP
ncbi:MAG: hypothetical protein ACFFDN_33490 [Candidatus Hodarchaeota archaeon]